MALGWAVAPLPRCSLTPYRHSHLTVGMNLGGRSRTVNVEAEDALIAALKVKHENSEAIINYVRKCNKRGDQRHPHKQLKNE